MSTRVSKWLALANNCSPVIRKELTTDDNYQLIVVCLWRDKARNLWRLSHETRCPFRSLSPYATTTTVGDTRRGRPQDPIDGNVSPTVGRQNRGKNRSPDFTRKTPLLGSSFTLFAPNTNYSIPFNISIL